jgi:hypothetical protein
MERWNGSVKSECIRPGVPLSLEDAQQLVTQYVQVYNEQRLHSAIGYVSPQAMLEGRQEQIHAERDRKLDEARRRRRLAVQQKRNSAGVEDSQVPVDKLVSGETEAGTAGTQPS